MVVHITDGYKSDNHHTDTKDNSRRNGADS